MEDIDQHLGERVRRRRRELGLTQAMVGLACGVRLQQIQKYECGQNRMSAVRLWQLAKALRVDMSYFFIGLDETARAA